MGRATINLLGQRFGRLTVTDGPVSAGSGKSPKWHCLCDCGTPALVSGKHLRGGDSKSCGCLSKEGARERIKLCKPRRKAVCVPGATFGRLTLVAQSGRSGDGRALWRCSCECGGEKVVHSRDLRDGSTKSCGCLARPAAVKKPRVPKPAPFQVGAVFGRLTVVEEVGVDSSKSRRWLCACSCGGTKTVTTGNLMGGNTKSCGCLARELAKANRMTVKVERRRPESKQKGNPVPHKPTAAQKSMHSKAVSGLKKAARPHTDLGPWTPAKGITHMTPPAQRDPRAVQVPAPAHNHRYGVDASEITPLFSAMRPGQYLEAAA